MPQAPEHLQRMFEDDSAAMAALRGNFSISRGGIIYPKVPGHVESTAEKAAIVYLCLEWDYGYMKERP